MFFDTILVFLIVCQTVFCYCKLPCQLDQLLVQILDLSGMVALQVLNLCGLLSVIFGTLFRPARGGNVGSYMSQ